MSVQSIVIDKAEVSNNEISGVLFSLPQILLNTHSVNIKIELSFINKIPLFVRNSWTILCDVVTMVIVKADLFYRFNSMPIVCCVFFRLVKISGLIEIPSNGYWFFNVMLAVMFLC